MKRSDQFQKRVAAGMSRNRNSRRMTLSFFIRAVLQVTDFFQKSLGLLQAPLEPLRVNKQAVGSTAVVTDAGNVDAEIRKTPAGF